MTRRSKAFRIGLAAACLMVLAASVVIMAATPVGTTISATATAQYSSSNGTQMPMATSNTVTVTVTEPASVSVSVSPASATKTADASLSASYGLTVTNTGSGSDTFDLTANSKSGSTATIYQDPNGDGVHQSTESTMSATSALAAGASAKCVVVVTLPSSGTTDTVTFTAKSRTDATKTAQSVLTVNKASAAGTYIQTWLVNGYYPNTTLSTQMSTDYLGGEANVAPTEGSTSGGKTWAKLASSTPYVNLWTYYGKPKYCVGYAFTYVYVPVAQTVIIKTGSDDGIKVWCNGAAVLTKDVQRGYTVDSDTGSMDLQEGWNKVLVKVTQKDWDWGFSLAITDSAGGAIPGLETALAVPSTGTPAGYVQTWLVNGYYPNSTLSTQMTTDYLGGEANVAPTESSTSGGKVWTRIESTKPYVDLWAKYGKPTYCVGYAFTYVYSPKDQTVTIKTGSDDGIKVFLNGTAVLTKDVWRGYTVDSDTGTMSLKAGWNKLLVKVSQKDWDWGFSLKICDSVGNAVEGVTTDLVGGDTTGGGTADTTAPTISNIKITPGSTSATVEWDTDEASTTLADYGTTTSLGANYSDATMVTHHSASLTGLTAGTTYYVKVGSADAAGNTGWSSQTSFQTATTPVPTTPASYIQTWLINGYYPNATFSTQMSTDYLGGEANVSPYEGSTSGGKAWAKLTSSTPYVNLWTYYGKPKYCVGYAFTYVYSPTAQTVTIKTGSDDGIKVILNGTAVLTKDVWRGYTVDSDTGTMDLQEGWNKLLVKVSQKDWDWGFSLKICDSAGNAVPGVTWDIVPPTTGGPVISNLKTTPSTTSATIEWDTNEPSNTMVDYGSTSTLGASYTDDTLVTHHKATITGLNSGSLYYAKIGSADAGAAVSWNGPFKFPTTTGSAYIQTWLVNGYYPNSTLSTQMSTDYVGGEANLSPTEGSNTAGKAWLKLASTTPYVNVWTFYNKPTYCVGYAFTRVYSPTTQTVTIKTGSDDGIKVWCNGNVVETVDLFRSYTVDSDTASMKLNAGWNSLLLKITQKNWDWGFSLKICDSSGNPVPGVAYNVAQ